MLIKSKIIFITLFLFVLIGLTSVSAADNQTDDIVVLESDTISQDILTDENEEPGTFTELKNEIAGKDTYELSRNYTYVEYMPNGITLDRDNFVLDGKGYTINAANDARIFTISANNVTLKNINFINGKSLTSANGGAIFANDAATITITNCNFTGNTGYMGGAIRIGSNSVIEDCNFINNTATSQGGAINIYGTGNVVKNSNFENNILTGTNNGAVGGAIYSSEYVNIENCNFTNSRVNGSGGVLYLIYGGHVKNSKFTNNNAVEKGGAILSTGNMTIENCILTNNSAAEGGAIFASHIELIKNTIFNENSAETGGAIYVNSRDGSIENNTFNKNHATENGGAIFFHFSGSAKSSEFINNTANNAGAILFQSDGTLENCVFTDNQANTNTGAVWFNYAGNVKNCNFTNNNATYHAGAIYFNSGGTVENSNFESNYVYLGNAGAIYFTNEGTVKNTNFTNNNAKDRGGAIYFNSKGTVETSAFKHNYANYNGGAIYFSSEGSIENSTFESNFANFTNGGAAYFNSRGTVKGSVFTANNATMGGAVYFTNLNSPVTDSRFIGNNANKGGAIYYTYDGNVAGSTFIKNTAADSGGAIYANTNIDILTSSFSNNTVLIGNGGAVFTNNHIMTWYCEFAGNTVLGSNGAAIYTKTGIIKFSQFTNNTAKLNGTVFISDMGIVENSIFMMNKAGNVAGAVMIRGPASVKNCNFIANTAVNGGALGLIEGNVENSDFAYNGAIVGGAIVGYNITVNNSNFINNMANQMSGAVHLMNKSVVYNSNFTNNTCANITGGVTFMSEGILENCNFVNNSGNLSGAVFFYDIASVKNCNFTNNTADLIGAVMLAKHSTFDYCNFIGNKAKVMSTVGYMIPVNNLVTITNSNFLYNVARDYTTYILGNLTFENITFLNNKNELSWFSCQLVGQKLSLCACLTSGYIHGLITTRVTFKNVTYWNGTIVNSDDVLPKYCEFPGINITIEIYNSEGLFENVTIVTNATSTLPGADNAFYDLTHLPDGDYTYKTYHLDDNYYFTTKTLTGSFTLNRISSAVEIITAESEFNYKNCTISFNVINRTEVRVVITDKNGNIVYDEFVDGNSVSPDLAANDDYYNITVYNQGTSQYAPSQASKLFKILKLNATISILPIENTTYGNPVTVTVESENVSLMNVTVYDEAGNIVFSGNYSKTDIIQLPVLAVGKYNVTVSNINTQNTTACNDSVVFWIVKAINTGEITVENVTYANPTIITITAEVDGNYTLNVNGSIQTVEVIDGSGKITLYPGAGTYYANATLDNGNYTTIVTNATFEVYKATSSVNINPIANVTYATPISVEFTGVNGTMFNVTVYDEDKNIIYTINTTGSVEITEHILVGEYNVTVINYGDANHTESSDSVLFNITKATSSISISPIADTIYEIPVNVEFANVGGVIFNVTVYDIAGNMLFTSNCTAGETVTLPVLDAGQYNVSVINYGDENYTGSTDSILFNILKAASSVTVNPISNVTYSNPINVEFTGVNGTLFNVTVYDNDKNIIYTANVTEPVVITDIIAAGQYNVTVTNYADANHNPSTDSVIFNITKASSSVTAAPIANVTYGTSFNVDFTAVNGTRFKITIYDKNGDTVYVNEVTGPVTITRHIDVGEYNVTVTNYGDANHTESTDSILFNIVKAASKVTVNPIANVTYEDTFKVDYTTSFGKDLNVTIYDENNNIVYTENLTFSEIRIKADFAVGKYNFTLINYGDANHYAISDSVLFNITKATSSVTVNPISNVTYSNSFNVEFSGVNGTLYNVTVYDTDKNIIYTVNVTGSVTVTDSIAAGQYNVTVTNYGDANHTESTDSILFNIVKASSAITVNPIANVTYTNPVVVSFTGENITTVNVTIYNADKKVIYTANITGSPATISVPMGVGKYNVTLFNYGDENHTGSSDSVMFNVTPKENIVIVTVEDVDYGANATVKITADADGEYVVDVNGTELRINVVDGAGSGQISLPGGAYYANATFDNENYTSLITNATFNVNPTSNYDMNINISDSVYGENVTVNVTLPDNAEGTVNVTVDGENYTGTVKDGVATVEIPNLPAGDTQINITYSGDSNYANKTMNTTIHVQKVLIDADDAQYGLADSYEYIAKLVSEKGKPVSNKNITFTVNGKTYNATTDENGTAKVTLTSLTVGEYDIVMVNELADNLTKKIKVIARLVENVNLVMDYDSGKGFTVKAIGDDGNPISGAIVTMSINGKTYNIKTDSNGVAKLQINLKPNTYTITCSYKGTTVKNTIKVKYTLKAKKTFKVKKTAKKLVLKAKLKWSNGKAIKGKKITFKFKGKKYTGKTNKKGVAKVTIKKKVIKKLKKGKKYKVKITYKNESVKTKVKVKK